MSLSAEHWIREQPRLPAILVALVSAAALAIALIAQHWGGLQPCVLCIYQRYVYGLALAVGLCGALVGRPPLGRAVMLLAGLVFLGGMALSVFHVGVEQHWWRGTDGCHAPALDLTQSLDQLRTQMLDTSFVPCDEIPWSLFGISMAGYNALASLGLALASFWAAGLLHPARLHRNRPA